jgi:hypothetical protein
MATPSDTTGENAVLAPGLTANFLTRPPTVAGVRVFSVVLSPDRLEPA